MRMNRFGGRGLLVKAVHAQPGPAEELKSWAIRGQRKQEYKNPGKGPG